MNPVDNKHGVIQHAVKGALMLYNRLCDQLARLDNLQDQECSSACPCHILDDGERELVVMLRQA